MHNSPSSSVITSSSWYSVWLSRCGAAGTLFIVVKRGPAGLLVGVSSPDVVVGSVFTVAVPGVCCNNLLQFNGYCSIKIRVILLGMNRKSTVQKLQWLINTYDLGQRKRGTFEKLVEVDLPIRTSFFQIPRLEFDVHSLYYTVESQNTAYFLKIRQ